jgi:hypothetical protein
MVEFFISMDNDEWLICVNKDCSKNGMKVSIVGMMDAVESVA